MTQSQPWYYLPSSAPWPIFGSTALFLMTSGAATWFNGGSVGRWMVLAGALILLYMLARWFGQVIGESEGGRYSKRVDVSFRWGMGWFIFSEVMFFAAFFGVLFYVRVFAVPDLADIQQKLLWPNFTAIWPTAGPYVHQMFTPMDAWGIPALNTLLLLSSGVTVTIAHWGLVSNKRVVLNLWLFLTIVLGLTFLGLQITEYYRAYTEFNLKLTTGIYGSTFFILTGFHGLHVTIGCIMLSVILVRCLSGHFKPDHHFAFEAVAWYWHFVDVVWLLLFIFVYWL